MATINASEEEDKIYAKTWTKLLNRNMNEIIEQ